MHRCAINYTECGSQYSKSGLAKLSPKLTDLKPLPFSAHEQRQEAMNRAIKMSIQGFQPKLSAVLSVKNHAMEIVNSGGKFIIKPQSDIFTEVPENEDVTMKMAKVIGIEVPLTGLIYSKDGSLSYFIKRFDRYAKNKKKHVEDFAQLTNNTRETKYNWSMEKIIPVIENHCTFPLIEKKKLFRRTLFCFLVGNEDMHLKNFSLIRNENQIKLSPAYDLLNSTISMKNTVEEIALPLAGKKRNLKRKELITYFGKERLKLSDKTISSEIQNIKGKTQNLNDLINISFLSTVMKEKYLELLSNRYNRLIS